LGPGEGLSKEDSGRRAKKAGGERGGDLALNIWGKRQNVPKKNVGGKPGRRKRRPSSDHYEGKKSIEGLQGS